LPPTYVPPTPTIQKQSDALNDSWIEQYYAEQSRRAALIQAVEAEKAQKEGMAQKLEATQAESLTAQQEVERLGSQFLALQTENRALRQQLEVLQGELAGLPRPVVELVARQVYRGIVPTPIRLRLRDLRTRR
ncbi:MAG: hypothetical protein CUN53_18545, partial [Phototrophicales bacterium]